MHPICDNSVGVDRSTLRIKDEHLARVLEGKDTLLFDGAMGTMLQRANIDSAEISETLPIDHPEILTQIHREYVNAGSEVATTDTFGANALKLEGKASVDEVFAAAVKCARNAGARYVAADIGPIGSLLEPLGEISFDEAYDLFAEEVRAGAKAGADIVIIETMADLLEAKAAVLAAKENCDLPIFVTMTFGEHGKTFLGVSPDVAAVTLEALGVQALGINCSLGPDAIEPFAAQIAESTTLPVIVQANAGLPTIDGNGNNVYSITPDDYANAVAKIIANGATIVGGCCGTDPTYIEKLATLLADTGERHAAPAQASIASTRGLFVLENGERAYDHIDENGAEAVARELANDDVDSAVDEAVDQTDEDADIICIPAGDASAQTLHSLVEQVQTMAPLPILISSSNLEAIEETVRSYAGKPLIEYGEGTVEKLDEILPIASHYGCAVLVRANESEREAVLSAAAKHGVASHNVFFE